MARKHRTGPCHGPGQNAGPRTGPNLTGQMYIYSHATQSERQHNIRLCLSATSNLFMATCGVEEVSEDVGGAEL